MHYYKVLEQLNKILKFSLHTLNGSCPLLAFQLHTSTTAPTLCHCHVFQETKLNTLLTFISSCNKKKKKKKELSVLRRGKIATTLL